jgi:uncharacterized protein YkuJ
MTSTCDERPSWHGRAHVRKRRAGRLLAAAAFGSAPFWLSPKLAHAVDPFEIQVYDGTADAPGAPGLELHLNTVPNGRKTAEPPELAPNHQTHLTLEPSLGIEPWWELGGYLQSSLSGEGKLSYAGIKLRSKFVTPKGWSAHWRFGMNLELSRIPQAYDRARWGGEARPIVAFEDARWLLVVNPILELSLAGPDANAGPSFAPAMMAKFKIEGVVALGVEYYGDFGPISAPDAPRDQQQYLFEAVDLLAIPHWEVNAGVGEGFTHESNALTLKAIIGYSWDSARLWTPRAP